MELIKGRLPPHFAAMLIRHVAYLTLSLDKVGMARSMPYVGFRLSIGERAPWEEDCKGLVDDLGSQKLAETEYNAERRRQIGNGGMKIDDVQTRQFV